MAEAKAETLPYDRLLQLRLRVVHQVLQDPPERYGDGHEEEYPGDEPCLGVDANLEEEEKSGTLASGR